MDEYEGEVWSQALSPALIISFEGLHSCPEQSVEKKMRGGRL
ncbi:hypothetical protein J2129_002069 [Methanofollis sp. W23]|nr:hypothetical protein [Methanofollis sp. W23]